MISVKNILFFVCLFSVFTSAFAQEDEGYAEQLQVFIDDFSQMHENSKRRIHITEANLKNGSTIVRILNQETTLLENNYHSLEFRWNAFTQTYQPEIAENDYLMDMMTQAEQLRQAISDSVLTRQKECVALADFFDAEAFILSQDSIYKKLYKRAFEFSLAKQTAPQLEKVKAEEQTLFEKIAASYEKSKAAAQLFPQLSTRVTALDEQFYSIRALSGKIQGMEYKPPIERIKDWLLGLASVAVILLFVNMLSSKIRAAKELRKTLKEQKKLLKNNNNNDYPTI